jgi:hypothetical protein
MKKYDEEFYKQISFLLKQYRDGDVKSIPDLMQLIQMLYGDYTEFHPDELPETRHDCKLGTISTEGGRKPTIPPS